MCTPFEPKKLLISVSRLENMDIQAEVYDDARIDPGKEHFHRLFLDRESIPTRGRSLAPLAAWRMVDPEGEVGMEMTIVELTTSSGAEQNVFVQIPLTYRSASLGEEYEHALLGTMHHSYLGERWVYDARYDPVFQRELVRTIEDGLPAAKRKLVRNGQIFSPTVTLNSNPAPGEQPQIIITLEPPVEGPAETGELRATWRHGDHHVTSIVAVQGNDRCADPLQ